jgi:phosphatidylglycerophosphatase A
MGHVEFWLIILGLVMVLLWARGLPQSAQILRDSSPPGDWSLKLWIAQGFGLGRIPRAPGTFGSIEGILWFALLVSIGRPWIFAAGTLAGIALSVWLCGEGEKILHQTDPGSVVLDEIIAMPVCFLAWVGILYWRTGTFPGLESFFSGRTWPLVVGVFAAFRFFDIVKPWPVRQSQALPGGWGVTIDDLLAAVYVNLVVLAAYAGWTLWLK